MRVSIFITMLGIVTAALALLFSTGVHSNATNASGTAKDIYIRQALVGDLSDIADQLRDLPGESELLESFHAKFLEQQHAIDIERVEDPFIKRILTLHIEYWRQALLYPSELDLLETQLKQNLVNDANAHLKLEQPLDYEAIKTPVQNYIQQQGYGVLIFGRTPPLIEFMLWKKNDTREYTVQLTDGLQTVRVSHIGDFISHGWSHYATNGIASTGGWATKEQLFCVCGSYDLESENFLVSYLQHEARHFADYKSYPKLQSASLEYRAKLTELVYAQETSHNLLNFFANSAVKDTEVGHSLANWHVVNDMKEQLNIGDSTGFSWESVDVARIQTAARQLLTINDQLLTQLGPETTENTIFPSSE